MVDFIRQLFLDLYEVAPRWNFIFIDWSNAPRNRQKKKRRVKATRLSFCLHQVT